MQHVSITAARLAPALRHMVDNGRSCSSWREAAICTVVGCRGRRGTSIGGRNSCGSGIVIGNGRYRGGRISVNRVRVSCYGNQALAHWHVVTGLLEAHVYHCAPSGVYYSALVVVYYCAPMVVYYCAPFDLAN